MDSSVGRSFYTLSYDLDALNISDYVEEVQASGFYEVVMRTEISIDFPSSLNVRIPYLVAGDKVLWLGDNANDVQQYASSSTSTFIFSGEEIAENQPVKFKGYVFSDSGFQGTLRGQVDIYIESCTKVSAEVSDTYEDGYEAGYQAGQEFGYSDGYNSGFSDGENKGYNDGFEAGKESVDTESVYIQGFEAGREVAYVEGYDEGYAKGYAEALLSSDKNTSSLVAGAPIVKTFSGVNNAADLDYLDFNTNYPTISDLGSLEGYVYDDGDGDYQHNNYFETNLIGYHLYEPRGLITMSSDVYAYYIEVAPTNVSYSSKDVLETRLVLGTKSEIMSGNGEIGEGFADGQLKKSCFWYVNDYKEINLCYSFLSRYITRPYERGVSSFNLWWDFQVTVYPYTKEEYNASVNAIEKQTLEIKKQTVELEEQTEEMKEQTETQKGMLSKMTEFFGSFFDNLKNAVVGLFVPTKEEMGSLFDRLMEFFNETFGFLFYPFDFLIELVELFLSSEHTDTTIIFPGFSIMGMEVWKDMEVDLQEYDITVQIFGYVRMVTGSIIAFGFINYLRKYFDKRFGGGGS